MPHAVVLYTPNLEDQTDMTALCRSLARAMQSARDEAGKPVFPLGGIRVFAYPAPHFAVADSGPDNPIDMAFCWINIRMAKGRSALAQQNAGQAATDAAKAHFAPVLAKRLLGLTLQVDEGHEVFDAKFGNLHAHFNKA
jgi:5-carboxymethyl-2-hydroxymuconate isomerase